MECVGLLLQCEGVEVNAEDMNGEATPLQYSVRAGHEAAVDLLLSYGASCGPEIQTVLREKLPHLDPVWFSTGRTARPLKNILFNLIKLGDGVPELETYVAGRANVDWDADNGQHSRDGPRWRGARAAGARRGQHQAQARDRGLARPPPRAAGVNGATEHEMLRIEFEQSLAANDQTGPINKEKSLQTHKM